MRYTSDRRAVSPLKKFVVIIAMALLFFGAGATTFAVCLSLRPITLAATHSSFVPPAASTPELPWPASSQASIGTTTDGILASKPGGRVQPTASTIKLLTALAVLKEKPLKSGEQGPTLTMDQNDMALYSRYVTNNGSVASIQLGEQLTEYQLIQGVLIRSANNFADTLALWAFGDHASYQKAATAMAHELGMTNTTIGSDASGLSPTTTSTAEDLTRLGIAAMNNDVIRSIVRETSVTLPIDGVQPSTNWLLGTDGVVGVKTGTTNEAGGVFIIASEYTVPNEAPITIVAAVQGEPSTPNAMTEAKRLVDAAKPFFTRRTIVTKGQTIATLDTPWGARSAIVAAKNSSVFGWQGAKVTTNLSFTPTKQPPLAKGTAVGTLTVGKDSVDLIAQSDIPAPSWWWRVTANQTSSRR